MEFNWVWVIVWIGVGIIVGLLSGLVMNSDRAGVLKNILVAIAGALVGGFLAPLLIPVQQGPFLSPIAALSSQIYLGILFAAILAVVFVAGRRLILATPGR